MKNIGVSVRHVAIALAVFAACSVPPVDFTPTDDAGGSIDMQPDMSGPPMLVVSTTSVTVDEASTATFTVQLSAPPANAVLVSIDSEDDNRVGVAPTSAQFDATNWNQPRTVTLSGREDADTEHEQVDVTITSSVGDVTVNVTVMDNDQLRIVVAPTGTLQVNEGGNATLAVRLSAQPSGAVTVTVASADSTVAGVSPTTLSFGTSTWDVAQNVVVTGQQDADVANDTTMVTLSATTLQSAVVNVEVVDDDVLGILPSTTNLGTLNEGGTTTFTVRLTQQPTSTVTVNVSSSDTMIVTATPTPLTFTTANWMTPQTVTVNLPHDVDTADETATISLAATGLTTRTVSVSIDDDDIQTIVASPDPVPVDEGGTRALNVRLQFQPSADITLAVTSLNQGVATVSPATLTFTSANYTTTQPVTVSAPEDADALPGMTSVRLESLPNSLSRDVVVAVTDNDQLLIETSTTAVTVSEGGTIMFGVRLTAMPASAVSVSVSSGDPTVATVSPASLSFNTSNYGTYQMVTVTGVADVDLANESLTLTLTAAGLPSKTVDATVNDDDVQGIVVSTATTTVNEGGTGTVTVRLAFMPASDVTVNIASADTTAATVSPATRTFTPANYATPQNITITGVSDADAEDDNTTINFTAAGVTPSSIAVTVQDDDALGIETSVTTIDVPEPSTATFQVRLTAQPPADTTVMVMSSDVTAATVAPAMLTFTTSNYNSFQTVTLTGVSDVDGNNDNITVTLMATGMATRTVTVTVIDDDNQDILLTTNAITLGEAGSNTFGVRLAAAPTGDVVVTVASANTNKATASPAMLTFNAGNYTANQTVTVSGVADLDMANESVAINMSSPGVPTRTVTATVNDDDMQVVETTASGTVNLTEGAAGVAVGFRLRFQPAANTTVTLNLGTGLSVAGGNTLTFTPVNYATPQTKTISAVQDDDAADLTTSLTASAPMATSVMVSFFIDDDDTLGIDVSTLSLSVTEGLTGQFGVRLTAQPPGNTTVTVASNDISVATITAGASLTFTTTNWNSYQNATVSGVHDVDVQTEGTNVTVSSVGLATRNVGVTVVDDDTLTLLTMPASVTVNEGATATFGVTLSNQPSSTVTVGLASSNVAVMTIGNSPPSLSFDPSNWNVAQNVAVAGVSDADATDGSANAVLTSASTPTRNVAVTVLDDDITLTNVSVQMGPAAGGGTAAATGTGFTAAVTGTMSGNAVTSWTATSGTNGTFTIPAKSPGNPNWADLRLVKGGNSVTIPRAHYYGQWQAVTSVGGGSVHAIRPAGGTLVYAGTFDGVYLSANSGTSYVRASTGLPDGEWIKDIAVNPSNPDQAYVPTRQGVYVTTNRGTSWARAGTLNVTTRCVSVNGATPSIVHTCTGSEVQRSTDGGATWTVVRSGLSGPSMISFTNSGQIGWLATNAGIYRTTDSGMTWNPANGNLPGASFVGAIVAHPNQGSTAYAAINAMIYKSVDGGGSWSVMHSGQYASGFAVDPNTPATVFAATGNGVLRSVDNGATWQFQNTGIPTWAQNTLAIGLRPSSPGELHVGGYTGVYRTTNGGQGSGWSKLDSGIDTYFVTSISPHPNTPGTVLMGTTAGAFRSTDYGVTWTQIMNGVTGTLATVNSIVYAPSSPTTVFMAIQGGATWKSTDSGSTWSMAGIMYNSGVLAIDPANPSIIYTTHYPERVMKSSNGGTSFTEMSSGIPANHDIYDVAVVGNSVLAADGADGPYRSTNGGTSWVLSNSGFAGGARSFTVDAATGTVYAVTMSPSRIYKSTDAGATWTLASNFGEAIAIDPTRPSTGYITSYTSVYRTLNAFASTAPFSLGPLPTYSCCVGAEIAVDRDGNAVYFAPPQRGLFRLAP